MNTNIISDTHVIEVSFEIPSAPGGSLLVFPTDQIDAAVEMISDISGTAVKDIKVLGYRVTAL